ncbi:PfkB family carbohydrate kinase [Acidobacteria bacterium AH-259-D05]|nr:PfkB family carbohydrate kinase [Acidobacteria bacterium AH-259-D05]
MNRNSKIKPIRDLAQTLATSSDQSNKKKIVHCHGVFDLIHIGHIRHLQQAKRLGDVLVVTMTPDRYVNKGPHRPAFAQDLRAESVAALDCVDYVALNEWPTAVEAIQLLKPDIYVKGSEYGNPEGDLTGNIVREEAAVKAAGGEIAFTHDIVFSSSSLINKYFPVFPKEVSEYLMGFSSRYSVRDVVQYLEKARALNVLVVGEAIIDEYQYCEQIGKSVKEPVLAVRYLSSEKFAGGSLAVANHAANFCDNVGLLTFLGEEASHEHFLRQHINNKVEGILLYKANSPTIVKRRFVEVYLLQKLFEVYEINDDQLDQSANQELCAKLEKILPRYDVVIVADYGHGMLSQQAIEILSNKAAFLAVNTQANARNRGFSTISKYPRADYVCLATHELALEERQQQGTHRDMILSVSRKLKCGRVLVTRGKSGSLGYSVDESFVEVPAFAHEVVDRMGAGDTVLSLTALCVAQHAPMEVTGFIGNVVGAQAVAMLGHRMSIEREPLFKHIESLLK